MSATTNTTNNKTSHTLYSDYQSRSSLSVAPQLCQFIEGEVLPDLQIDTNVFWQHFSDLINEFAPRNKALLLARERMQTAIDQWYLNQPSDQQATDAEQIAFLRGIGYIADDVEDFTISTDNADDAAATRRDPLVPGDFVFAKANWTNDGGFQIPLILLELPDDFEGKDTTNEELLLKPKWCVNGASSSPSHSPSRAK